MISEVRGVVTDWKVTPHPGTSQRHTPPAEKHRHKIRLFTIRNRKSKTELSIRKNIKYKPRYSVNNGGKSFQILKWRISLKWLAWYPDKTCTENYISFKMTGLFDPNLWGFGNWQKVIWPAITTYDPILSSLVEGCITTQTNANKSPNGITRLC